MACGSDAADETASPTSTSEAAAADETTEAESPSSLAGVCPDPVVIQTDWFATPERAAAYQLVGADGTIDADEGTYAGPLGNTGVEVEVRLGGPLVGFQAPIALLYEDPEVLLAYVATDEAVQNFESQPTTAVVAPLDINPQILMWDPATYDIGDWEDVAATGAPVLYLEGLPFMDHLLAEGFVEEPQLDASFDGSPARFVVAEGRLIQQGYASNEPYRWENDVEGWRKPVDFLLVHDSGYEIYPQGLAARPEVVESEADCLEQLVPMLQQAQIDYVEDPAPVNGALTQIGEAMGTLPLTEAGNADAAERLVDLDLVGNGTNETLGDFDIERVDATIATLRPLFEERNLSVPEDLGANDIVTNDFIDPSITLEP